MADLSKFKRAIAASSAMNAFQKSQMNMLAIRKAREELNTGTELKKLEIEEKKARIGMMKQFPDMFGGSNINQLDQQVKAEDKLVKSSFAKNSAMQDEALRTNRNVAQQSYRTINRLTGATINPMTGSLSFQQQFVTPQEQELENLKLRRERASTRIAEAEAGVLPADRITQQPLFKPAPVQQQPVQRAVTPAVAPAQRVVQPQQQETPTVEAAAQVTDTVKPSVVTPEQQGVTKQDDITSPELVLTSQKKNILGAVTDETFKNVTADKIAAGIEIEKQTEAQRKKDEIKSTQDLLNASLKISNQFDNWLDVVDRTFQLTGFKPGIINGSLTQILGATKANEFVQGFKGGSTEYAAAIGRIAIPGARAVRLVELFKGTAPSEFDTIESGIQTTADSYRNSIASDAARNPEEYGMPKKPKFEDIEKFNESLRVFENNYREGLEKLIMKKNPELLNSKRVIFDEAAALKAGYSQEQINAFKKEKGIQ